MTLSSWLRDYLYISLGGNRGGAWKTYRNLALTMLLGGLWHGASWNFVIWGGLHGLYLAVHRAFGGTRPARDLEGLSFTNAWRTWLTFNLVCFAWIFFRAQHFDQAWAVLTGIGSLTASLWGWALLLGASPLALGTYALASWLRGRLQAWMPTGPRAQLAYGGLWGVLGLALALAAAPGAEFIYFQF